MFGIATAGGRRGQHGTLGWRAKACVFAGAGLFGGAAAGFLLGVGGSVIPSSGRIGLVSLFAAGAVIYGCAYVMYPDHVALPQRDCETDQGWMDRGELYWAARNGLALGMGFTSRIGIPSWYIVPTASFACGDPLIGGLLFALYGGVRCFLVLAWVAMLKSASSDPTDGILAAAPLAKKAGAAVLVGVGMAAVIAIGA